VVPRSLVSKLSLTLLALARSLQNGQVIFFGYRVTYSRSAYAPQMPGGKPLTLNISSALASAGALGFLSP
jgi:hypothetical protein